MGDSKEKSKDSNEHSDSDKPTNDLNNLGEVIKALLGSFGVNVDVSTKTESDESDKKSPQEGPMDSENSSESKASENKEILKIPTKARNTKKLILLKNLLKLEEPYQKP